MKLCSLVLIILTLGATAMAFVVPVSNEKIARTTLSSSSSKWDNLIDEDEDEDEDEMSLLSEHFVAPEMQYNPRNVGRQNRNFVDIRTAGGTEVTNDLYVRQRKYNVFWFEGKIARVDGVSVQACVARQYPLIAQHAANLRPLEMYPHHDQKFEFWAAPGDSEMEVAYNRPVLQMTKIVIDDDLAESCMEVRTLMIGFQGEMYEGGEEGFHTWRDEDGYAVKPEVKGPDTGEQEISDDLMKKMEGMDAQKLWEEQERRAGRSPTDD
mmetsp:Transcript_30424/g.45031  ORF Transcript_30424/g.45031 Transcript_30424/m.45031 type:complete len:266 (+) Transcript_30424:106-903(+)